MVKPKLASLSLKKKLSLFKLMQNQKAHYSSCQALKNDLLPSGFDLQILTILLRLFPFPCSWGDIWSRKPQGFMGHFTMAHILTHHFYCDFCQMEKYWCQKSYGSGLSGKADELIYENLVYTRNVVLYWILLTEWVLWSMSRAIKAGIGNVWKSS